MGQKRSTLSARSQEFLVSLMKVSYQKISTSLICYQQKGEWRRENSSTHSPWYLPLFSHVTFTFFNAPLVGSYKSVAPAFLKRKMDRERSLCKLSVPHSLYQKEYPDIDDSVFAKNPAVLISMCFARQHFPLSFWVPSCMWSLILLHVLTLGISSLCSLTEWLWLNPALSSFQQYILIAISN